MRIALRLGFSQCENCRHKLRAYFDFSNSWCNVSIGCCFSKQRTMAKCNDVSISESPIPSPPGFLRPTRAGSSDSQYIVRGKDNQLFSKTFSKTFEGDPTSKEADDLTAIGLLIMHNCEVQEFCTYKLPLPQQRVAFQTPDQSQFIGAHLSWNDSIWSYNVENVYIGSPEAAMFRPEGHFIKVVRNDKDEFELHSGIYEGVVLVVLDSEDPTAKLVMMPITSARMAGLTMTFSFSPCLSGKKQYASLSS
eukprot:scpid101844/ scgid27871/ 